MSHPLVFTMAIIAIFFLCINISKKEWRLSWIIPALLLLVMSGAFVATMFPFGHNQVLAGADDPLTHEGYARIALLATNPRTFLEAGASGLYWYQPLYRYFVAGVHLVAGESLWAIYTAQTWLFAVVIICSGKLIKRVSGSVGIGVFAILLAYILIREDTSFLKLVSMSLYQQALALPLLFLSIVAIITAWLNNNLRMRTHFLIGLIWGIALMTRTDYLPTVLGILVYIIGLLVTRSISRKVLTSIIGLIAGSMVAPLLIVIRNLIIVRKLAFLPTSGYINLIPEFQQAIPEVTKESFGVSTLLIDIPLAYSTRLNDFIAIIWPNMRDSMLTADPIKLWLWGLVIIFIIFALLRGSLRQRFVPLILIASTIIPLFIHGFFIHTNLLPSISHYSFLVVFLFSLSIGLFWQAWFPIIDRILNKIIFSSTTSK